MKAAASTLGIFLIFSSLALAQGSTGSAPASKTQFALAPHDYVEFPYFIPSGAKNVKLKGSFSVKGGSPNVLFVLVMTDEQFEKWKKGPCPGGTCTPENGGALYNSGAASESTIDLSIPDGKVRYHLVFNNDAFSDSKSIAADLKWQWTMGN